MQTFIENRRVKLHFKLNITNYNYNGLQKEYNFNEKYMKKVKSKLYFKDNSPLRQ
jgi:hypothetical protein